MKLRPNPAPFCFSLGNRGELVVSHLLKEKGYEILDKNYRCKIGEIDVIARRNGRLAFIEVKTRTSGRFGMPQEAVDRKKQEKIFKRVQWYMKDKRLEGMLVAFDVVAVLWRDRQSPEIRLIQDAYEKEDEAY